MAVGAVVAATLFNGFNMATWTGWVFFALGLEILLIFVYTVSPLITSIRALSYNATQAVYSAIKPDFETTYIYGNYIFLFHSAYFWLGLFLVIPLSLLPRLAGKAYKFMFNPSDIDRVRYLHKLYPDHDFAADRQHGGLGYLKRAVSTTRGVRRMSIMRRNTQKHTGSRTDMATGVHSSGPGTGFDFAMEEGGPALRRLQSNLSGRSQPPVEHKRRRSLLRSIGKSIRRKRVPTTLREEDDDEVTPVASKS